MKKWNNSELQNAINDFLIHLDKKEMENRYGRKFHNIEVKMLSLGIKRGYKKLIVDEKNIINQYKSGVSMNVLSSENNVDSSTIKRVLVKNNIQIRKVSKKYYFNESYFKKINTEDKAYFLGFLFADGCNFKKESKVALTSHIRDEYIIKKLMKCLRLDKPPQYRNKYCRLQINSPEICKDLENLGCVPRKTFKLKFPKIKKNIRHHFIRGYFDGDGCISYTKGSNRLNFSICSTEIFLRQIQKIFIQEIGLNKTKIKTINSNCIKLLRYSGNINCVKIKDYLYKNSSIYLKRKYDKFMTYHPCIKNKKYVPSFYNI